MVNELYLFSAFLVFQLLKALLQQTSHSRTKGRWLLYKEPTYSTGTHTHTSTHQCRSRLEQFGVQHLAKDTTTCRPEELGIEPLTFLLVDDPLYLLSHSRPHQNIKECVVWQCLACVRTYKVDVILIYLTFWLVGWSECPVIAMEIETVLCLLWSRRKK